MNTICIYTLFIWHWFIPFCLMKIIRGKNYTLHFSFPNLSILIPAIIDLWIFAVVPDKRKSLFDINNFYFLHWTTHILLVSTLSCIRIIKDNDKKWWMRLGSLFRMKQRNIDSLVEDWFRMSRSLHHRV